MWPIWFVQNDSFQKYGTVINVIKNEKNNDNDKEKKNTIKNVH